MKKNRAARIISASVIAASTLVVAPTGQAATVSEAEKLVKAAKDAGTVLKWAISIEGTADGKTRPWAAYNNAKAAYDRAVKAVNTLSASQKSKYMADLDENVKLHINRTMYYIDAITAGEKIREKQDGLAYYVSMDVINDSTEKAYHELSTEIRKQAILLDRVYGQSTRNLIRSNYKGAAEAVRDSAKFAVTVKIELDLAAKAIAAKNYVQAEKHLTEAKKYLKDVASSSIKKILTDRLNTIDTNFTAKVEKVSAEEPKRIKVAFNKAMLSGYGTNSAENTSNYSVTGRTIKSVKLSDDKKTAIIELYDTLLTNSSYTVNVRKNIQSASNESLGTTDYSSTFTFSDKVKPTVTQVVTNTNGNIELKFSEFIDRNSPLSITIDGKSVTHVVPYEDSETIVITKSELERLSLRKGRSYSIAVSGARDLVDYSPNTMNAYRSNFVYNPAADTVLPVVQSVQAKGEKTLTLQFSEALADLTTSNLVITKGNTTIRPSSVKDVSDGRKTTFEVELPTSVYGTNEATVNLNVQIKNYKDLGDNIGHTVNRTVNLAKDLTAPRFVNANYNVNTKEIQITFNEPLNTGSPVVSKITILDKDNNKITPVLKANVDNKLIINAQNLPDGSYTIMVDEGAVKDRSISQNLNIPFTTSIVKKDDIVKPTLTFLETENNGQFNVWFSEVVTVESAQLYTNYLLDRNALPSETVFTVSDQRLLTVTLPEGAISTTKKYTIAASGIKDLSDNVMNPYTATITLRDNTMPVLMNATKSANDILLTFSENIILPDSGHASFEITVDGTNLTSDDYQVKASSNLRELIISPKSRDTLFTSAGNITVKTTTSATVRDGAGNSIKGGIELNF